MHCVQDCVSQTETYTLVTVQLVWLEDSERIRAARTRVSTSGWATVRFTNQQNRQVNKFWASKSWYLHTYKD